MTEKSVEFYVLAQMSANARHKPGKVLYPTHELLLPVKLSARSILSDDHRFKSFLHGYCIAQGEVHMVSQLKQDKALARAIGGTEWRVLINEDNLKVFVSQKVAQDYLESADRPEGPQDRLSFMRDVLLENFDDLTVH